MSLADSWLPAPEVTLIMIPPPCLIIGSEGEPGQVQRVDDVGEEVVLQSLDGRVDEVVHVTRADVAGVVYQHVDPAIFFEGGVDQVVAVGALKEVEFDGERLAAEFLDLAGGGLQAAGQGDGVRSLDRRGVLDGGPFLHRPRGEHDGVAALWPAPSAHPRPIPRLAPVTIATFLSAMSASPNQNAVIRPRRGAVSSKGPANRPVY